MEKQELIEKWLAAVKETGIAAKGSIHEYKRNCGSKKCRKCRSGERHPTHQLTYYLEGKQHSRHVGPRQLEQMQKAIANGRKLEELLVCFGLEYLDMLKAETRKK